MTLKELQTMIKEELDAYVGEAEDDVDVSVSDTEVDAELGDEAAAGEEDVLRQIFDLLKAHFEGEEVPEEAPEEPSNEVESEPQEE